jgi:hypothetical protein
MKLKYMSIKEGQRCNIARFQKMRMLREGNITRSFDENAYLVACGNYIYSVKKELYYRAKETKNEVIGKNNR